MPGGLGRPRNLATLSDLTNPSCYLTCPPVPAASSFSQEADDRDEGCVPAAGYVMERLLRLLEGKRVDDVIKPLITF